MSVRLIAAALLLAVLLVAAAVLPRDESFAQRSSGAGVPPRTPSGDAGEPFVGSMPQVPRTSEEPRARAAMDRARERQERRQEQRRSPQAKQERQASKSAHENLDDAAALALARAVFPELLDQPAFRPFRLRDGERVLRWLGDFAAQIEDASGEGPPRLVESLLPVRTENADGDRVPTDYELVADEDGLRPKAPHTDTVLGKRLRDGVRLPASGLRVAPEGEDVPDGEAVRTRDKLFFAGGRKDVDHVVTPTPGGVELNAILRSKKSPERLVYRFDLPVGARLTPSTTKAGGIEVVQGDRPLALVSPPVAWDADQTPVPASYRIQGDRIVVQVDHRDGDFRMPIAVDPTITEDQRYWYTNPAIDKFGWTYDNPSGRFTYATGGYLGEGLYSYSRGTRYFDGGNFANWLFRAPGDSRIVRAEFGYVTHEPQTHGSWPAPYNDDYVFEGIFGSHGRYENGTWCEPSGHCGASPFSTYGGLHYNYKSHFNNEATPGNAAVFQTGTYYSGNHTDFTGYQGSSAIVIDDSNKPQLYEQYGLSSTAWTSYRDFEARGYDYGLGMKRLLLDSPGNPGWSHGYDNVSACRGDRTYRCGQWLSIYSNTTGLPEGVQSVRFSAWDAVNNDNARSWPVRLDRTAPTMTVSGDLRSLTRDTEGRDLFELRVDARDGDPNGPDAARRSGVASIRVLVDGVEQPIDLERGACAADSCPLSAYYEMDTDEFAEGRRTVRVEARDQLGHLTSDQWTIEIPRDQYFAGQVQNWRTLVEQRVDDSVPALPLTSRMPIPPSSWTRAAQCTSSPDALKSCFDETMTWGRDVERWLKENGGRLVDADNLPAYPLFIYALERGGLQVDLTNATQGSFELAKRAGTSSDQVVTLQLAFREPVGRADLLRLAPAIDLSQTTGLRGVFQPGQDSISGALIDTTPALLTQRLDEFYASQKEEIDDQVADLSASLGDAEPEEPEETEDIQQLLAQSRSMSDALASGAPYVTALRAQLSPVATSQDLISTLMLTGVPIKAVQVLSPELVAAPNLDPIATDGEMLEYLGPYDESGARISSASAFASADSVTAAASRAGYPTCDIRGNQPTRRHEIPRTYMPGRWEMKVALIGSPDDNNRYLKRNAMYYRWKQNGSLSYFCGDRIGERGFEPETKPKAYRPRWSTDWPGRISYVSNLPRAYYDDISKGGFQADFGQPSTYPDFSVGTAHGRRLRYRKLYTSRYITNRGEANDGTAIIRGQQTTGPFARGHGSYCRFRDPSGKSDRYCSFGRAPSCVEHIPLRTQRPVFRRIDWSNLAPRSRCDPEQGVGD